MRLTGPTRLHDGARLRLGDSELVLERRRAAAESLLTIMVPAGAESPPATGVHPRVRPGYALKRLDAAEGNRRWVLKDLASGTFLRLSDDDAQLFEQLDGTRSLADLIGAAEKRFGAAGPARLARLLADLGERGLLDGVQAPEVVQVTAPWYRQALRPRERIVWTVMATVWVAIFVPVLFVAGKPLVERMREAH